MSFFSAFLCVFFANFAFKFLTAERAEFSQSAPSLFFVHFIFHQLLIVSFYYLFFVLLLRVSLCLLRVLRGFSFLLTTESTESFTEVHRVFYLFILYFINFLLLAFNIFFYPSSPRFSASSSRTLRLSF